MGSTETKGKRKDVELTARDRATLRRIGGKLGRRAASTMTQEQLVSRARAGGIAKAKRAKERAAEKPPDLP